MQTAPLMITSEVRAALHELRKRVGEAPPTDMQYVMKAMKVPRLKQAHLAQMTKQSLTIPGPWDFCVTYSLEAGHPVGLCRHMSMSIMREGRVPSPEAVQMVARELGFKGDLAASTGWTEKLSDGGIAVNLVQQVAYQDPFAQPKREAMS